MALATCLPRSFTWSNCSRLESYYAFIAMLNKDAADARTAVGLVLAQPSISSQLVDNLNASIHLRALLTDLFLMDEIVRPEAAGQTP
jgi:hypothetical protein